MFESFWTVWKFINYWYFRYLMVTELYMVETWERVVMNTSILTLGSLLFYCNYLLFSFFYRLVWSPDELVS